MTRLRLLLTTPNKPTTPGSMVANIMGNGRNAAVCVAVVTVTVTLAGAPIGVTEVGLNVQLAPAGRPEQENCTASSNPFSGVIVNVTVPF
jgi:hypothetical protein